MSNPASKFRYFVRLDGNLDPIPGSLIKRKFNQKPKVGNWVDVTTCAKPCCNPTTTTTTSSTTTTTTTT